MPQYICQEFNEKRFSRKFIDDYIKEELISNPINIGMIKEGVVLVNQYITNAKQGEYYASKNIRIVQLVSMDIEDLVINILTGIAYCQTPELFTSMTAILAGRLRFDDKLDSIKTISEIVAILCVVDAFDINKPAKTDSLQIVSKLTLSDKLLDYISTSTYLPPMVCEPKELTNNYSSAYLTFNDSLILGSHNHHDGNICLDVLNKMNAVKLQLDLKFLCTLEEEPKHELINREDKEHWMSFKKQSYSFYCLMESQGNEFHITHKVDKRGRIYAQGYHINTGGAPFKKATIELSKEVYLTGVP